MSHQKDQSGRSSRSRTTTGSIDDPSIHLRDVFGSQYTFDDDPSVVVQARKKAKEEQEKKDMTIQEEEEEEVVDEQRKKIPAVEGGGASAADIGVVDSTSPQSPNRGSLQAEHAPSQQPMHPVASASSPRVSSPKKTLNRIRRPVSAGAATPNPVVDDASVVSAAPSIHLRDIFGSQYTYDDDPSVVVKARIQGQDDDDDVEEEDLVDTTTNNNNNKGATKEAPRRSNSTESGSSAGSVRSGGSSVGSTGSRRSQTGLRQRKHQQDSPQTPKRISFDRIRRPIRTSSNPKSEGGDDASAASSSPKKQRKAPVRTNSFVSKIHLDPLADDSADSLLAGMDSFAIGTVAWGDDNMDLGLEKSNSNLAGSQHINKSSKLDESDDKHASLSVMDIEVGGETTAILHASSSGSHSHNSSIFRDEPSDSNNNKKSDDDDDVALLVPSSAFALNPPAGSPFESPQQRFCISCTIFTVFAMTWFGFQAFSILWWNPDPFLPSKSVVTVPPEAVGPPIEDILGGNLPDSTVTAIQHIWDSPQSTAFRWLHADPNWIVNYNQERRRQRFALAVLYFSTNPPYQHNWNNQGRWLSYDVSECEWLMNSADDDPSLNLCHRGGQRTLQQQQQEQDDKNMVQYLPLQKNNLVGPIPEEILLLSSLTYVRLDDNGLTGEIPGDWMSQVNTMTTLQLQGNPALVGQIPWHLCTISDLRFDCKPSGEGGVCGCQPCKC